MILVLGIVAVCFSLQCVRSERASIRSLVLLAISMFLLTMGVMPMFFW